MLIKPIVIKPLIGIALILSAIFVYLHTSGGSAIESIGNAYVSGRIVELETDKSGTLKDVMVKRGTRFNSGDVLFKFDPTRDQLNVERQQSELRRIIRESTSRCLAIDALSKDVQHRKIQSELSQNKLSRYKALQLRKELSEDLLEEIDGQAKLDKLTEEVSDLQYRKDHFLVSHRVMDDVAVMEALVELKNAVYELSRNNIYAPFSGYVYEVQGFSGLSVERSKMLALIVPDETIFVEANILETRLKTIKVGQKAKIYSDIYGKEIELEGMVNSIVPATASIFSSLPRNNVDSNWIKVNQRVPVLIQLQNTKNILLPLGTSVKVDIDIAQNNSAKDSSHISELNQAGENWENSTWEQDYQKMTMQLFSEEAQRFKTWAGKSNCVVKEDALAVVP